MMLEEGRGTSAEGGSRVGLFPTGRCQYLLEVMMCQSASWVFVDDDRAPVSPQIVHTLV